MASQRGSGAIRNPFSKAGDLGLLTGAKCLTRLLISDMERKMELGEIIGDRIKNVRLQLGITQAQLAAKLQMSAPLVTQWEKGVRKPSADALADLAKCLDVSLDFLFGRSDINSFFPNEELISLFDDFMKLPSRDQATVKELIRVLVNQQASEHQ